MSAMTIMEDVSTGVSTLMVAISVSVMMDMNYNLMDMTV